MKRSHRLSYIGLIITVVGISAFLIGNRTGKENIGYLKPLIPVGIVTFICGRFLD